VSGAVIAPDDAVAALRSRLLSLRADALRQLAEADTLDAGMLALLGNDGERMTLVLYAEANKAAFAAACPRARWRSHRRSASTMAGMTRDDQLALVVFRAGRTSRKVSAALRWPNNPDRRRAALLGRGRHL